MRNLIKNVVLSKALVNVASPALITTSIATLGGGVIFASDIESKNAMNIAKLDSKDSIIIASLDSNQTLDSIKTTNIESNPITLADSSDSANNTSEVKSETMSDTAQSTEQSTQTTSDKTNTAVLNKVVTSATGFSLPLKDEPKNIILIDKQDLEDKGYTNLEQALEKQPSVTFVQGPQGTKQIDIRGQGGLDANRAVKILVNRVPININDAGDSNGSHSVQGITPFNLISIDDVESIEIIPGGGAVVYGNGTRGGVVNIVTKKPSKDYMRVNARGSMYEVTNPFGLGAGAGISAGRKITDNLFIGASADYSYQNGLRPKEYTHNIYTALNTYYEIDEKSKLEWNFSYSKMWRYFAGLHNRQVSSGVLKSIEAMKNERYLSPAASQQNTTGEVQQDFFQTSLNYTNKILENLDFDSILYYQFSYFRFPEQNGTNTISHLNTHGAGLNLKTKWTLDKNILITGIDNQFEYSDNLSKGTWNDLQNKGTKYSLSFYGLDSYKFFDFFSLSGGARAEISYFNINGYTGSRGGITSALPNIRYYDSKASTWQFGYALEITPSYNYSDTGAVYFKQEIGFISPNIRQIVSTDPSRLDTQAGIGPKIASNIKPEQYFTSEIGWRDEFDWSYLSATLFYTHTLNEIRYVMYSGSFRKEYFNLGATQRFGIEFSGKQDFDIGGVVPLNIQESFSYIYSNVLKGQQTAFAMPNTSDGSTVAGNLEEGKPIPYVPLLKIALLIDAEVLNINSHKLNVFWNNTYYGNQVDNYQFDMNPNGYFLSDIGLNYKLNDFTLSAGVRNVFDSFYIAYQLANAPSATTGAFTTGTYLAGEGRNYFLEGRYSF